MRGRGTQRVRGHAPFISKLHTPKQEEHVVVQGQAADDAEAQHRGQPGQGGGARQSWKAHPVQATIPGNTNGAAVARQIKLKEATQ